MPPPPPTASTPPSAFSPVTRWPPTATSNRGFSCRFARNSCRTTAAPVVVFSTIAGALKAPTAVTVPSGAAPIPAGSSASSSRTRVKSTPSGSPLLVFRHPGQARFPSQVIAWRTTAAGEPAVNT